MIAMRVEINGKEETVADGITVRRLLEEKGINPNLVACELNLTILKRANLASTPLREGDRLEIIQMIGGG
jgi:sulfur carrier protein